MAREEMNPKDTCVGDWGSPLVNKKGKNLVGIVSHNVDCGITGSPSIYLSVFPWRKWITDNSMFMYLCH